MTYASNTRRPNPVAMLGALGIPAAIGALLVVGLAVNVVIAPEPPPLKSLTFKPVAIPPPPPDPTTRSTKTQTTTTTTTTSRPAAIPSDLGISDPIGTLPGIGDLVGPIDPVDFGIPGPAPSASPFDPVAASPRGNPGNWVTDSDYRPRWIREGLTGSARFTLSIDAGGKVTGCTIARSTGHVALDQATCQLVSKRARFAPARDGNGKAVAGRYDGSINWRIPE
jgi:protein TonB